MSEVAVQLQLPYLEAEDSRRPAGFIPVYEPWLGAREAEYVLEAVTSGWISSLGKYVAAFEQQFAAFCGAAHGICTSNGTTALHLALHAMGVGPGDEVIVPALTFVATANAVHYTGARPVFADVDPVTWTIRPDEVERLVTSRTVAILPVHLYGAMAPMVELQEIAAQHGLRILEDAAEAHGAAIGVRRAGTWGDMAAFSFFGNKIITTGEGGMLTTGDAGLAARCRQLRDHGMPPERRYWHDEVGFNYRMTNLQAAVGVAQMERIEEVLRRKREIAALYCQELTDIAGLTLPVESPGTTNVYWMVSILVDEPFPLSRDALVPALREHGIDSRPFFHPLDTLPPYRSANPCPVALRLGQRGLNLPSSPRLRDEDILRICRTIRALGKSGCYA
jgi:perosamine synthetase